MSLWWQPNVNQRLFLCFNVALQGLTLIPKELTSAQDPALLSLCPLIRAVQLPCLSGINSFFRLASEWCRGWGRGDGGTKQLLRDLIALPRTRLSTAACSGSEGAGGSCKRGCKKHIRSDFERERSVAAYVTHTTHAGDESKRLENSGRHIYTCCHHACLTQQTTGTPQRHSLSNTGALHQTCTWGEAAG